MYRTNYASVENEVLRERLDKAKAAASSIRHILLCNRGYLPLEERRRIEELLKDI